MAAENLKKVKILVLGDTGRCCVSGQLMCLAMLFHAGVGKSSLVHLICHKEVLSHSTWTVGCTVEVKVLYAVAKKSLNIGE